MENSSTTIKEICHSEHELTLHGEGEESRTDLQIPEEYQSESCRACGLRIFITPTYICLTCKKFFIHKKCAELSTKNPDKKLLQLQIDSTMELKIKIPDEEAYESIDCVACGRRPDPKSYIYVIDSKPAETLSFIHLSCAFEIRIRHKSHRHDLIALRGESYSFRCGGCGKEHAKAATDGTDVPIQKNMQSNAAAEDGKEDDNKLAGDVGNEDDSTAAAAEKDGDKAAPDGKEHDDDGKEQYKSTVASASGDVNDPKFYVCNICGYWIHHECASLPAAIGHRDHSHASLSLTFAVSQGTTTATTAPVREWPCDPKFCCETKEKIKSSQAYFCSKCEIYVHISCATKDNKYETVRIGDTKDDAIILPLPDDKHNSILHLKDQRVINYDSPKKTLDRPELHEHILILHKNDVESDLIIVDDHERTSAVVCDACVEPILNSDELQHHHYRCRDYCRNFFLHLSCAELLKPELDHQAHKVGDDQHILELFKRPPSDKLLSLFTCECCGRKCNGFAYGCMRCDFYLDVVCAFLPKLIKHGVAHNPFHVLSLRHSSSTRFLNMSNTKNNLWFYDCRSCSFTLHAKCALLPGIAHVGSEFDEHTLKLVPPDPNYEIYSSEDHFCEICEEEIDVRGEYTRNKWYYSCSDKCDRLFHVECLPSVSPALSMVKFGQGIRVKCHECEVVSVRMLTVGSHQCDYCKEIIEGRKDEIALKCSKCNFWMHYECAEKCRQ